MNKKYFHIAIFSLLLITCKKDLLIIEGCTNYNSHNYNPNATIDDGSCSNFSTSPYLIPTPAGFPIMKIPENIQQQMKVFY